MRDDEFQKAIDIWAESEIESAPDLHPTAEMVRLVQTKQETRRARPTPSRWAMAGAAAAGVILIAALFALILRSGAIPGYTPTPEPMLIAQRVGPSAVQTTIAHDEGKGTGERGASWGLDAFRQLLFEIQRQDSPTVQAVDLLNPPEETVTLTPADNYRLTLEPGEERYVYAYQLTSSGSLVQLFPDPAYSAVANPLAPGQLTRVPAEPNWLYLGGAPGEEQLYVIASPQPFQELDDLYAQYTQEPDEASKREILPDLLHMLDTIAETRPDGADAVVFVFLAQ